MTSGIFWVPVPKADPFLLMVQTTSESSVLLEEGSYEVRSKLAKTGIMSSSRPRLRGQQRGQPQLGGEVLHTFSQPWHGVHSNSVAGVHINRGAAAGNRTRREPSYVTLEGYLGSLWGATHSSTPIGIKSHSDRSQPLGGCHTLTESWL